MNLVDPMEALRASLTAAVVVVSGWRPESSMTNGRSRGRRSLAGVPLVRTPPPESSLRTLAPRLRVGPLGRGWGTRAPGTRRVATHADAGSNNVLPMVLDRGRDRREVLSAGGRRGRHYHGRSEGAPVRGLQKGRADVAWDIGRAWDGGSHSGKGRGVTEGRQRLP